MKKCTICHLEKPITEFYKNRKWFDSKCKLCSINNANEWKNKNPEKRKEQLKKWRALNRGKYNYQAQMILSWMKQRSKKKNFQPPEWNLEEIKKIINEWYCEITKNKFTFNWNKEYKDPYSPSPDRIDNNIWYTKQNTQWVCTIYNLMKNNFSKDSVDAFILSIKNLP